MPSAVPYTPRGFVPDRWEPNSGRLVDLARARGRDEADAIRHSGELSANLWSGIGQNVAGTLRDIAAMPEQARQRQMQDARLKREEAAYTAQQTAQQQDAAKVAKLTALTAQFQGQRVPTEILVQNFGPEDAADISQAFDELFGGSRADQQQARIEANELGAALPPGAINEGQLDVLRGSPAQAGRTRYSFGPGTAEGPELMPTADQQELTTWRHEVEAKGGMVGPGGQAVMPPRDPVAPNPTEYSLALEAARGDPREALRIIRNQRPPAADRDPVDVVIQGPTGPLIVNRQTGTSRAVMSPEGASVGPTPGAMERMDARKFSKAAPVIASLDTLSERINTGAGLIAKAAGGVARLKAQANYDDDVAEYQAIIEAFTPLVARALGHTGVLTQIDVDSAKALFPKPGDSKTLRDRKSTRLNTLIDDIEALTAPKTETVGRQVGSIVSIRGQQQRITKVYPDGSFDAVVVK